MNDRGRTRTEDDASQTGTVPQGRPQGRPVPVSPESQSCPVRRACPALGPWAPFASQAATSRYRTRPGPAGPDSAGAAGGTRQRAEGGGGEGRLTASGTPGEDEVWGDASQLVAAGSRTKHRLQTPMDPRERVAGSQHLKKQTTLLQHVHPTVLAKALLKNVIHQQWRELIVVNKPYGIPVHGGPGVGGNNVAAVLPVLEQLLDGHPSRHRHRRKNTTAGDDATASKLYLCHRLDRDTTGVLVLARNAEAADAVASLLRERRAERTYWAVTVGVPQPARGVVDLPVGERKHEGPDGVTYRMAVMPRFHYVDASNALVRRRLPRGARTAVTQYRVLAEGAGGRSALVELRPLTGHKHQLRVHLALGLGTPALGDHKYSPRRQGQGLVPQRLSPALLRKLGLASGQERPAAGAARRVPLHLHACRLVLPGLGHGRDPLVVQCRPPKLFMQSLKKLGIQLPEAEEQEETSQ
ncbi:LOW QUALITY PROTEIN: pseudouridylate synthase RPUSD4, mitochondrial-like [Lethenteron reissneri]|uniref:LOW QUALITY PROTEIN: pseudouridylate synthase RPUSD4, mitochondrial-like n=1 Tax=Lethenteron reissneri TaxID=7753 RepID=UPI002AB7C685|nr:LOW QUALITY PROTEIN: pseudouridylate synthase RPUSD4, mitochondrial-like [Lethenteron reissneri]